MLAVRYIDETPPDTVRNGVLSDINSSSQQGNLAARNFPLALPLKNLLGSDVSRANTPQATPVSFQSPESQQQTHQPQPGLLRCVSETIRKTKAELGRSGWIHAYYIMGLVIYSAFGGMVFWILDGEASDKILLEYKTNCSNARDSLWHNLTASCQNLSFTDCQTKVYSIMTVFGNCTQQSQFHQITQYSTAHYMNALIYAITVYTTIGYGTIAMSCKAGRVATILYSLVGIPLFFAFLNDIGQWFQRLFLHCYARLRLCIRHRPKCKNLDKKTTKANGSINGKMSSNHANAADFQDVEIGALENAVLSKKRKHVHHGARRHTKPGLIFTFAILFLIMYFCSVSLLLRLIEGWNLFDCFWFLFQSVSLIGFGDVFPSKPRTMLFTITFIIIGISLLSMCFFILQEWIREHTSKLSRRVRYGVRNVHSSVRNWYPIRTLSSASYCAGDKHRAAIRATASSDLIDAAAAVKTRPRRLKTFPPMTNFLKSREAAVTMLSLRKASQSESTQSDSRHVTFRCPVNRAAEQPDTSATATPETPETSRVSGGPRGGAALARAFVRQKTFWAVGRRRRSKKIHFKHNNLGGSVVGGRFQLVPEENMADASEDDEFAAEDDDADSLDRL